MKKIIIVLLRTEDGSGDTLNASHAVLELTPELREQIETRLGELQKASPECVSMSFRHDAPYFQPADEQIIRGDITIQDISDERFANLKRFSDDLNIEVACEMKVERHATGPEIRLYMYHKHTGLEVFTDDFEKFSGFVPREPTPV